MTRATGPVAYEWDVRVKEWADKKQGGAVLASHGLAVAKQLRVESMATQQFAKFAAVALGQARRVGDVAVGDAQQKHQIVALEAVRGRRQLDRRFFP